MATSDSKILAARTVGVIDIGANSVRMVIAQVWPDGRIEELERTQRPVALGHDTFVDGRLGQQAMNTAIGILRDCAKLLDLYGVETVRAVATSAVREADNSDAFVDRVALAVGLDLEVLDPTEESRLVVSALRCAVDPSVGLGAGRALIADVGGGSTLLTVLEDGIITACESYGIGSIRLQEHLAVAREPTARAAELLRHRIASTVDVVRRTMPLEPVASVVAVGEDVQFAAQHAGAPMASGSRVSLVSREGFDRLVAQCVGQTPERLAQTYGIPFPTAVRLVPALLTYQALLRATGVEQMAVGAVSMRDGLLLDLARVASGEEDTELAESAVRSAKTIGEKYRVDASHAEHVSHLATVLFDELQAEHGLSRRHRLLLRVAAVLHECGKFVSNRSHHKHSYYLIANAEVFGLSRREIQVAAHIARYHRRSAPKSAHLDYMTLPREERMAVNKLASVLRVGDALERGHQQQVREFEFRRRPGEFGIYVHGVVDLTLERLALAEKADLFEETFGLRVRIEEAAGFTAELRRASPLE